MSLSDKIIDKEKDCHLYQNLFGCGCCAESERPDKVILFKDVKEAIKELKLVIRQKLINTFPDIDMEKYLETAKIEFFDEIDKIFGEKLI